MTTPAAPSAALPTNGSHRVWRVGADIDTDQLAPGKAMKFDIDVVARHCLEAVRPEFAREVQPGDVLVAGPNFGIGSSREQAAAALVHLGVAAVIAPSFNGLYFRNAFNVGLLLMTCPEAERLQEGECIALEPRKGRVVRAGGEVLACEPIPEFLVEMIDAGGLVPLLQRSLRSERDKEVPR